MARKHQYPEGFRFLDEQHGELLGILGRMKQLAGKGDVTALAKDLLTALRRHSQSEEQVMAETGCPDLELHAEYHEHVFSSLEYIIQLLDRDQMQAYRSDIATHIENILSEEFFFDRLLIEYLERQQSAS